MEIVSIPLKGLLAHGDSKKNSRTITVGDIQVMSAGTGIYHSEMNGSKSEPVEFLQIWIIPKERNTHPLYQDYDIRGLLKKDELAFILSPDGSTPAKLLQDTWFSMGEIGAGKTVEYTLHGTDMGVYVFLIEGEVKIDDVILTRRDGLGISEIKNFEIETLKDSKILLIEVTDVNLSNRLCQPIMYPHIPTPLFTETGSGVRLSTSLPSGRSTPKAG